MSILTQLGSFVAAHRVSVGVAVIALVLGGLAWKSWRHGRIWAWRESRRRRRVEPRVSPWHQKLLTAQEAAVSELQAIRKLLEAAQAASRLDRERSAQQNSASKPSTPPVETPAVIGSREKNLAARPASTFDVRATVSLVLQQKQVEPRARWMDLDVSRGAEWAANREVHLLETADWGGPFILISDASATDRGWVLPNPKFGYFPELMRPVYPSMTETQFGIDVEPVPVRQSSDGRWRVERSGSLH